nr:ABC transporter ATP-binding protein [Candidatus Cloacimonadota bacterium]
KKTIFWGFCCLIVVDAIQMVVPKIIQHIIDFLRLPGFTTSEIFKFALLIFILAIIMAVLRFLWRLLLITNAYKIERKIRNEYYAHLQKLSASFFQKHKTGNLMAYATNDLQAVRMFFGIGIVLAFDFVLVTIASLALMSNIDLRLTIYVVIPLPLITFVMIFFGRKLHRLFKDVQRTFAKLSDRVQESISGIRVIKSFVRENSYEKRVSETADHLVSQNIHLVKIWGIFFPFMFAIVGISLLLTLYFGGTKTILNQITIGEFVAFNSYLHLLIWPVIAIGWVVNLYQRGTASLNRIQEIMKEKPEIIDGIDVDKSITELKGNIEFRNLKYTYPESKNTILDGISFSINSGETLAIVGRTGEGKSTIIKLLTRLFNPPKESIFIDGKDIYQIPLLTLRKNIGIVMQDIFLFSTSIEDNIRFGKQTVSQKDIIQTTQLSHFYNDITEFEGKFNSVVGERGLSLSGGQKQRLAISRALIIDAPILILDDAFSSVDTETEEGILSNLKSIQEDKTTLIIAHRISTMQHADKIVVLDNGKIAEEGNHESLIKQNGIYTDIYNKQKLREELEM